MGCEPAGVDFALVGHPESWSQVQRLMDGLRDPGLPPLSREDLREIVPWIPARTVERFTIASATSGRSARGIYVETFLPPEELGTGHFKANLARVDAALSCAAREGARIASLGGFTSILLEVARRGPETSDGLVLTTGNTLTASFIVRGVERAASRSRLDLSCATLLVIGSTGDLGSACTEYFAPRVRRLSLWARREAPLVAQVDAHAGNGVEVHASTDPAELLPQADVIIAVASLAGPGLELDRCKPGALVCDAGYPKNLAIDPERADVHVFWGGMGQAREGWENDSPLGDLFYRFPAPAVAHGCMLEGMVLGLEGRVEAYSWGRGNITPERMAELEGLARRHGIVPAPLFNQAGLWPGEPTVA
ncbi:MAG: hypothetical protein P8188_16625 [Gemmatimonadota bacterium]